MNFGFCLHSVIKTFAADILRVYDLRHTPISNMRTKIISRRLFIQFNKMIRFIPKSNLLNEIKQCRFASNINSEQKNEVAPIFTNRNPRNLERMRIGYKPDGYHVDFPDKRYWHKLLIKSSGKYVTASIHHYQNGEVLTASTSEWLLKKQLYRTLDTSAYINLGKILAQRCLQSGLTEISCFIKPNTPNDKVALLLKELEDGGVSLTEPPQYKPSRPWDIDRPEKPWEVTE